MQQSRYGKTDITSEYLLYPFKSPIQYNVNYTGTFSKYSIIDKYYANSLVKPVKRLYYGGAEWSSSDTNPVSLTFSLTDLAYSFGDEILFKTASMPGLAVEVSDATYDRIDAIVINEDGQIKIKTGTPALSPKKPVIEEDEVLIQYALIKKVGNAAQDKIGTREVVYERGGSSWDPSSYNISGDGSGSSVSFNSTNSPYISTSCIGVSSDYRTGIDLRRPIGTIKRSDYPSLSMRVRLDEVLPNDRYLSVSIYGTSSNYVGTASSNTINLMAYGLERDIVGSWQHLVIPTMKFGSKVDTVKGIKFRMIGGPSASTTDWSLDYILFQTGVDYDEYMDPSNCGPCLGSTSTTSGGGGSGGGGTFSLTVEDYLTGDSFSDIDKIIFRGNTVVVNTQPSPNGLTATGVLVTQQIPNQVIVWIPAPNYVNAINPTIDDSGLDRYVSLPSSNSYTSSSSPGTFGIGDWSVSANFSLNGSSTGTTRKTKNSATYIPFTQATPFSVSTSNSTTIKFEVFKEDETTAIRTITKTLSAATCNQTHVLDDSSLSGASLALGVFSSDQDKFKVASITATVNLQTVFPNGGRFRCRLTHDNLLDGIKVFNSNSMVFDFPIQGSSVVPKTTAIVGTVSFDEKTAVLRRFSGIAYYNSGSTFAMTASNIDLLNQITFPSAWKQIDFYPTNMAIENDVAPNVGSLSLNGHADGTKSSLGNAITGWSIDWNRSGLTFSRTATINYVMVNATSSTIGDITPIYIPGFQSSILNSINTSKFSSVTARLFDYTQPTSNPSVCDYSLTTSTKKLLIDTDVPSSVSLASDPIDSENKRLSFSSVFSNGSSAFNSNVMLDQASHAGELQYIFGRIIYPQHDFTTYRPYFNFTSGSDYSSLSGTNKSYDCVTPDGLNGSAATTPAVLNGYRWYVSSFSKSDSTPFTGGLFRFECNWLETDLHCRNGVSSQTGSEDLALILGYDDTGSNATPTKFFFLTGNTNDYGGRTVGSTNQLTGTSTSAISFSKGTIGTPMTKCWLFAGYKNTVRGKQLILSDVLFVGN